MIRYIIIIIFVLPFNLASKSNEEIIYLPIVFHVLYEQPEEKVSTAQIQHLMDELNSEFNSNNNNLYDGVRAIFHHITGNPKIEFVLSQIKNDNNFTYGLLQKKITTNNYFKENIETIKKDSVNGSLPWDISENINVWICRIQSMNPDHIRYSGITSSIQNKKGQIPGIVIDYRDVKSANTLIHEMGHFWGLQHTWGNLKNTCDSDDGFTDTPNCRGPSIHCKNPKLLCDSIQQWENWMDYSLCPAMFTLQQCDKMRQNIFLKAPKMIQKGKHIQSNPPLIQNLTWPEYNLAQYSYIPSVVLNHSKKIPISRPSLLNSVHIKGEKSNTLQFHHIQHDSNHLRKLFVSVFYQTKSQRLIPVYFSPIQECTINRLKKGNYIIYLHQNNSIETPIKTGVMVHLNIL